MKRICTALLAAFAATVLLAGCGENAPPQASPTPDPAVMPIVFEDVPGTSAGWKGPVELADGSVVSTYVKPGNILTGQRLTCIVSRDSGATWKDAGTVDTEETTTDFGDAALTVLESGEILCSYRYNKYNHPVEGKSEHEIRVAVSRDSGATWSRHSLVERVEANSPGYNQGEMRGLWSTFLFVTSRGDLQCYYDDENVCFQNGLPGHQWFMMKTWNPNSQAWENPVTVSRSFGGLSRDGQGQVVEIAPGKLLCAVESVRTTYPYKGCVRLIVSEDYGATWQWRDAASGRDLRRILYVPEDENYSTLCPWIVQIDEGVTMCAFMTDEDRDVPDDVAGGKLDQSIKYMLSFDGGETWKGPYLLDDRHPLWGPGIIRLRQGERAGQLLYQCARTGAGTVLKYGRLNLGEGNA